MVDVWARLEPHLASVQKPARYIGCELGAEVPSPAPGRVGWLLVYPDTYEIGLPNQGLQILYEILNERPDALAERSYAPWTDLEEVMRREGLPLFSVDTHRSADEFDVLAFNLSAELVYTNVLNCLDLAGVPVRSADRTAGHPLVGAGGHATYNPEPLADFLDFVVLGDGEEVVGEINEAVAAWIAGGRAEPRRRPAGAGGDRGRVRPGPLRGPLPARRPARGHRADRPGRPGRRREAHHRRPGRLALPEAAARAAHRGGARPAQRRGVPRLHPRLPVLPGRDDHPAGPRAPGRPGHLDDPAGPPPHRLRRGRAHEPVHRRLLGHRGRRGHRHGRLGRLRQRVGEPARACGSTPSPSGSPPRSRRPVAPASPSPPRRARGGCGR